jgi:hypothetical protein
MEINKCRTLVVKFEANKPGYIRDDGRENNIKKGIGEKD